jgi:protocatechuate 3,4-dioxygenase beta subunit
MTYRPLRRALAAVSALALAGGLALAGAGAASAEPTASLTGHVTGGGVGLATVNVQLSGPPGSFWNGWTGPEGEFDTGLIEPGTYTVRVIDYSGPWVPSTLTGVTVVDATTLDIALDPAPNHAVSGRVTDGDGNAIAGTWVSMYDGVTSRSDDTDADGYYTIGNLQSTSVTISAGGDGTWESLALAGADISSGTYDIQLSPTPVPEVVIAGTVVDRVTGAPIEGVTINLSKNWAWAGSTATGADGRYSFSSLFAGDYVLSFSATGYHGMSISVAAVDDDSEVVRDVRMSSTPVGDGAISGVVTTAGGAPLEGVYVSASAGVMGPIINAATAADGSYSFTGLAAGVYNLSVSSMGYGQVYRPTLVETASAEAVEDFVLQPIPTGIGSVHGTLTDTRTGDPIAGATVMLWSKPASGFSSGFATTDSSGAWVIYNLADGTYGVDIGTWVGSTSYASTGPTPDLEIVGGGDVVRSDTLTSLLAGTGGFAGKVKDAATHLGIPGAQVSVHRADGGWNEAVVADGSGDYVIDDLPPGTYYVSAISDEHQVDEDAKVVIGSTVVHRDWNLIRYRVIASGDGTFSGQVFDSYGYPISDAYVTLRVGGLSLASVGTGADGLFEFSDLPLGVIDVEVQANGAATGTPFASTVFAISLTESYPDAVRDIILADAASISGRVRIDGTNAAPGYVEVLDAESREVVATASVNGGRFDAGNLRAGDFLVRFVPYAVILSAADIPSPALRYWVEGDRAGSATPAGASVLTLAAGESYLTVDLDLQWGGALSGTVKLGTPQGPAELTPGRSIQVDVYQQVDGTWELQPWARVNAGQSTGGRFAVTGLQPGVYRLYLHDGSDSNRAIAPRTVEATVGAAGIVDLGPIIVTFLEPGDDPEPVNLGDLDDLIVAALSGRVSTDAEFDEGDDIEVVVGDDFAGEWVSLTANSTPQALGGWVQVGADGVARSTLPAGFSGEHRLVVQDADGQVIGWTPIAVTAAAVVTPTNPTTPVTPTAPAKTSTNSSGGKKSVTTATPAEETVAPPAESEPEPEPEETEPPAEPSDGGDTSGGSAAGEPDVAVTSADSTWFILGGVGLIVVIGAVVGGTVIMRRRA